MNSDIATLAAKTIATHWDAGTKLEQLSSEQRPTTMQEGYRIQNLLGETETLVGWKIAATSANQDGEAAGSAAQPQPEPLHQRFWTTPIHSP